MTSWVFRVGLLVGAGLLCGFAFGVVEDGGNRLFVVAAALAAVAILAFVMFQRPRDENRRAALDLMLGDMEDPGQRRIMMRSALWMIVHLVGLAGLATENPVQGPLAYAAFAAFAAGGFMIGVETWRFSTYDEFLTSFYLRALALTGLLFAFFVFLAEGASAWLGLPSAGLFTYYIGFSVILLAACMAAKGRAAKAQKA